MKLLLKLVLRGIVVFPALGALAGVLSGVYFALRISVRFAPDGTGFNSLSGAVELAIVLGIELGGPMVFFLGLCILLPTRLERLSRVAFATVLGTVFGAIVIIEIAGRKFLEESFRSSLFSDTTLFLITLLLVMPLMGFVTGVVALLWSSRSRKTANTPQAAGEINE